jgi:hypothetical protein
MRALVLFGVLIRRPARRYRILAMAVALGNR